MLLKACIHLYHLNLSSLILDSVGYFGGLQKRFKLATCIVQSKKACWVVMDQILTTNIQSRRFRNTKLNFKTVNNLQSFRRIAFCNHSAYLTLMTQALKGRVPLQLLSSRQTDFQAGRFPGRQVSRQADLQTDLQAGLQRLMMNISMSSPSLPQKPI